MTPTLRAGAALVGTAALTLALATGPVEALPTWRPADRVSPAGATAFEADLAVDASGAVVAVWRVDKGAVYGVQASVRPRGGTWSPPVDLSSEDENATAPQVGVDAAGNAVAVWQETKGAIVVVRGSTLAAGGAWSAATDLSKDGQSAQYPQVAVNAAGSAVVVWLRSDGLDDRVQATSRTSGGWSDPVELSAAGQDADVPQVGIDDAGRATAVWSRYDGSNWRIQYAGRSPAGVWGFADDLTPAGTYSESPRMDVDAAGHTAVVWEQNRGPLDVIQASVRPAGGTWSEAKDLSLSSATSFDAQVAIDAMGNATATWRFTSAAATGYELKAASRPAGGDWSSGVTISDPTNTADFDLVVAGPDGTATAIWEQWTGTKFVIRAARRPLGGIWSGATDVSDPATNSTYPAVAVDGAGDIAVAWSQDEDAVSVVKARGLDVAGPTIGGLTVPAKATAGKAASFTASATDTWSGVSSYAWSFGDKRTNSGPSVKHTYKLPGTYTVTLLVTDGADNTTTRTATVKVRAPRPVIKVLRLSDDTIARGDKTTLKVRLNTRATLKLVFKGKTHDVLAVAKKKLPKGTSRITLSTKVGGRTLVPDTYVVKATAKNGTGTSKRKSLTLKVVR